MRTRLSSILNRIKAEKEVGMNCIFIKYEPNKDLICELVSLGYGIKKTNTNYIEITF